MQSFAKRHPHELLEHPVHVDEEAARAYRAVAELERRRRQDHAREKDRPLVMPVQVREVHFGNSAGGVVLVRDIA